MPHPRRWNDMKAASTPYVCRRLTVPWEDDANFRHVSNSGNTNCWRAGVIVPLDLSRRGCG